MSLPNCIRYTVVTLHRLPLTEAQLRLCETITVVSYEERQWPTGKLETERTPTITDTTKPTHSSIQYYRFLSTHLTHVTSNGIKNKRASVVGLHSFELYLQYHVSALQCYQPPLRFASVYFLPWILFSGQNSLPCPAALFFVRNTFHKQL